MIFNIQESKTLPDMFLLTVSDPATEETETFALTRLELIALTRLELIALSNDIIRLFGESKQE